MDSFNLLLYLARIYLTALPLYATWIVGIVFAWRARQYHPRSARIALTGMLVALLSLLLLSPVSAMLPLWFLREPRVLGLYSFMLSFVQTLLQTLGWVCMIIALRRAWYAPATAGTTGSYE